LYSERWQKREMQSWFDNLWLSTQQFVEAALHLFGGRGCSRLFGRDCFTDGIVGRKNPTAKGSRYTGCSGLLQGPGSLTM
jgi:hypothetical protein